jgi:hypothetical protein
MASQSTEQKALSSLTKEGFDCPLLQVNFRPRNGISLNPSSEAPHHSPIKVGVILVIFSVNEVEITRYKPWTKKIQPDLPEFLQELYF